MASPNEVTITRGTDAAHPCARCKSTIWGYGRGRDAGSWVAVCSGCRMVEGQFFVTIECQPVAEPTAEMLRRAHDAFVERFDVGEG